MKVNLSLIEVLKGWNEVCIVGNGGCLINSGVGQAIDRVKNVVRFNLAEIKGYENDVGEKQTMRFGRLLPRLDDKFTRLITDDTKYMVIDDINNANKKIKEYEAVSKRLVYQIKVPVSEYERITKIYEYLEPLRIEGGLGFIHLCIEAGIKNITIAGFTTLQNYQREGWFEYYKRQPHNAKNWEMMDDKKKSGHDWEYSREILERMIKGKDVVSLT